MQKALRMIGLLVMLIQTSQETFKVELSEKVKLALSDIISCNKLSQLQMYVLAKFMCISENSDNLKQLFSEKIYNSRCNLTMDLTEQIQVNFALNSYDKESLNHEHFIEAID